MYVCVCLCMSVYVCMPVYVCIFFDFVYIYWCIVSYAFIYIYIYMCIYIYIHLYFYLLCISIYLYIYMCFNVCTYIHTYIHVCFYLHMYTYMCVCIYIYMHIYIHTYTFMCAYICIDIYMCVFIYIYIYTYIYIYYMRVCIVMRVQSFSHHLNPAKKKKTWTMRRRFSAGRRRQGVKEITMKSADQNLLHGPAVSKMERLGGWGSRKSLLAEPRLDKFMAKFGTPWFQDSDSKVPPEVPVPRGIQIVFPLMQSDQSVVECLILSYSVFGDSTKIWNILKQRDWASVGHDFQHRTFPLQSFQQLMEAV